MDTTFRMTVEALLLYGFLLMITAWVATSSVVLASRALHDLRDRQLRRAERELAEPAMAARPILERAPRAQAMLSGMTRRGVYRMTSSPALSPALAAVCRAWCARHIGIDQMIRDASSRRSASKWRRIGALRVLGRIRPEAVYGVLDAAVRDTDEDVASAACTVLQEIGDRRAGGILVSALRSAAYPPSRVATHLEHFPVAIHDLLIPLLEDKDARVRYWSASLLARYPNVPGLAARMAAAAHDADPQVRKAALATLGFMTRDIAVSAARDNVGHPVPFVRAAAVRVLARQGSLDRDRAQRREIAATIAPRLADENWTVRTAAKESLVRLGPATWHEVAAQLDSPDELARKEAAEVIQNLGVVDWTIESLAAGVQPGPEVVGTVTRALREGGPALTDAAILRSDPEASRVVEDLLSHLQLAGVHS